MTEPTTKQQFRDAFFEADGRPFHPLDNIILADEFSESRSGWYGHHIDREGYDLNWGVVCRSTMPTHWWGSYGAQSGLYSLKLATLPQTGSVTRAIKRLTSPYHAGVDYSTLRFETFFTYHEEPRGDTAHTEVRPEHQELTGEENVRGFVFAFDIHDRENRWWPGIRYSNWTDDERRATWQYNEAGIDPTMDDYVDMPGGSHDLCWNSPNDSVPWKPNWHYLRIDVDMETQSYREFQCNDLVVNMSDLSLTPSDPHHDGDERTTPWPDIDGLLNPIMSVQTNSDTRSFLFIDSLALSAEVDE